MDGSVRAHPSTLTLAIAIVLVAATVRAQEGGPEADRRKPAAATLPESNEALLLTSRAEEAIRLGDYRLAAELAQRIKDLPADLVASPASRTYYPVWRQATRLLAQFPAAGVESYRQLFDAELKARYAEATRSSDVHALRELFRSFPLGSDWPHIGHDLASQLLDRGEYGEAIQVLRELLAAGVENGPEIRGLLATALTASGGRRAAQSLVASLAQDAALVARPEWKSRIERLSDWVERSGRRASATGALKPTLRLGTAWSQPLTPLSNGETAEDDADLATAVETLRRPPLVEPLLAGERLLLRVRGTIWALDALTLTPLWRAEEIRGEEFNVPGGRDGHDESRPSSRDADLLLNHHLRHVISAGPRLAYTIESVTTTEGEFSGLGRRPMMIDLDFVARNELVARDLASGAVIWHTGSDPAGPLFDAAFQDAPQLVGSRLIAVYRREGEIRLAVLDPQTGALVGEQLVVGPPTHLTNQGGRCLLSLDETTLYVCTGNGVIAALNRDDLSWLWATVYPSTLSAHLGQQWWAPAESPDESGIDRAVVGGELIVIAPMDSTEIMALDRFSGREVWRIPRRDAAYLIGFARDGLVVGGNGITCLDAENPDGRPARWKSVPLELVGRPTMRDERIFAPTREGIAVIDARSGKLLDGPPIALDAARPDGGESSAVGVRRAGAANLIASGDALYAIGPGKVVKYPDVAATRALCERLEQTGGVSGARGALLLAWLDVLDGRYAEGVQRVEQLVAEDDTVTLARDRLLTHAFMELARTAAPGTDRLAFLRQAADRARSPETAARLAVIIGETLESEARWEEALRQYFAMLRDVSHRTVVRNDDSGLRTGAWLHAAGRLRLAAPRVSAADFERLVAEEIAAAPAASGGWIPLHRLRTALAGMPLRARVDQAIALRRTRPRELAPELLLEHVLGADAPGLSDAQRRLLHLVRFETDVSLDRLAEARRDAETWQREFAPQPSGLDEEAAAREADWVETIERGLAKATAFEQPKFDADLWRHGRRWKVRDAELLIDPDRPMLADSGWVLALQHEEKRIQLRDILRNQQPQRDRPFALRASPPVDPTGNVLDFRAMARMREMMRSAWFMRSFGSLAAIPVPEGLVCVGLGPSLYGGNTIWELPLPGWSEPPRNFGESSAADASGVFITPRPDRVALVGWCDGAIWWQRELSGVSIVRLARAGDALIAISDENQVFVMDAGDGGNLRRLPNELSALRAVDVVGEVLVAWGEDFVTGLDPRTLQARWTKRVAAIERRVCASNRPWIVFQQHERVSWDVLDVSSGELLAEGLLGVTGEATAAAVDGSRLLIASRAGAELTTRDGPAVMITSIALDTMKEAWSTRVSSHTAINVTQLLGHPDLIPVLIDWTDDRKTAGRGDPPYIALVGKQDGVLGEPVSIKPEYDAEDAHCASYVLVAPGRIIVQVAGNLIAFGPPPVTRER